MKYLSRYVAPIGFSVALLCSGVGSAFAEDKVGEQYPKTIEAFAKNKSYSIVKSFKTDEPTLTGYVLKNTEGRFGILYTLNDLIIAGTIVNADGANLSEKYTADNIPKPDFQRAVKILEADKTLIIEGKKNAPVMYVIADPNCIFCHKFFDETRDWVAQGKVQIHWAMVGFLKPSSAGRAAAIIAAKDRVKANAQDHEKFDAKTEEGSIDPLATIPPELQQALKQHETLMNELQFQGTPGLIFKDKNGQWQGVSGMPPLQQLATLMGISAEKK